MFRQFLKTMFIVSALAAPGIGFAQGEVAMSAPTKTDRVAVNGVELYYEIHGAGSPLLMLHGGVNPADMFGKPLALMAEQHEVMALHLRGHGLSSDAEGAWSTEQMADDANALLDKLGIEKIDVMGWSLGGGVALQLAIRHPDRVGRLVVVSRSVKGSGNYPEVQERFEQMLEMAAAIAGHLSQSPLAAMYPDVDWESLLRKTGEMARAPYDWSEDVARITAPTLLVYADADMMYPEHIAETYRLLGGGTRDAGVDGSLRPTANQLAIIPGTTHYNIVQVGAESLTNFAKAFLAQ